MLVRILLAAACLLVATACDENNLVGPTVPLNQRFTLGPGEGAGIQGASLQVQFVKVTGDSRCPADAICVWGGDAIVHVRAIDGGSTDYELHTGDSSRASALHQGMRIQLMELQPYPFSSRTIAPADYRATLVVSR